MIASQPDSSTRAGPLRVVVVDSARSGAAYPQLSECEDIDVVGQLPWLDTRFLAMELIKQTFALKNAHCPHGRPIWYELSRTDLFHLVGRV